MEVSSDADTPPVIIQMLFWDFPSNQPSINGLAGQLHFKKAPVLGFSAVQNGLCGPPFTCDTLCRSCMELRGHKALLLSSG